MNDTSNGDDLPEENVLRPFQPAEIAPLPPVEPSKVVPEPPEAVEEPPPPPPPTEADAWSPDAAAPEGETTDAEPTEQPAAGEALDEEAPSEVAEVSEDAHTDEHSDPADYVDATVAGSLPDAAPPTETITLPRKPFLIGLGVMLAALALFAVLWQSAGGDDDGVVAETATPAESDEPTETDAPADDPIVDSAADNALSDAQADLAASEETIAGLTSELAELQERPVPALAGDTMRRIIVGADAKFVDARRDSVAVVGAFGGVSLIDPTSNRVVANGNVADRATRVLRTESSVWLTNYADNQVLQVNPSTNTVSSSFAFVGPDDIEKDGDSLVIASFDGGTVARVQPDSGEILQAIDVGGKPTAVLSAGSLGMWAAVFDTGEIVRIHRTRFDIMERVIVGQGPVGLAADDTHLWVANHDEGTIAKVDPETAEVVWTVAVGDGPTELVSINGSVWVTVTDDGALVQVDAESGEILTNTPLGGAGTGGGPTGISYADGSLWVAMQGEQSVVRVEIG